MTSVNYWRKYIYSREGILAIMKKLIVFWERFRISLIKISKFQLLITYVLYSNIMFLGLCTIKYNVHTYVCTQNRIQIIISSHLNQCLWLSVVHKQKEVPKKWTEKWASPHVRKDLKTAKSVKSWSYPIPFFF